MPKNHRCEEDSGRSVQVVGWAMMGGWRGRVSTKEVGRRKSCGQNDRVHQGGRWKKAGGGGCGC